MPFRSDATTSNSEMPLVRQSGGTPPETSNGESDKLIARLRTEMVDGRTAQRHAAKAKVSRLGQSVLVAISALATACVAHAEARWPSKYGSEDTLGAVNNLSPRGVLAAAKLVKTGKVYPLAIPTGPHTPAFGTRKYTVQRIPKLPAMPDGVPYEDRMTNFDELVTTSMGIGTQIDGLGHFGLGHKFYNGISADELAASNKLEPAALPPIVTRGVLLDMTRALGKPMLEAGDRIGRAEIEKALKRQHLTIRKGDVVLLHTGWIALAATDPERFRAGEPGLVVDGAQYLADLGVVAVGADNIALEASPSDHPGMALVHSTLLTSNGVYILEMIDTRALAADGVGEFMFVLGVPRLRGTVQMTINPVAIR